MTPLVAAVMCLVILGFVGSARLAGDAARLAKGDAAAESAALAAALGSDAVLAAEANQARLLRKAYREPDSAQPDSPERVEIEVEYRGVRATAAAVPPFGGYFDLAASGGGSGAGMRSAGARGGGKRNGLAPEMLAALGRADRLLAERRLPSPIPVVSGYRSTEEQMALWARRATNPYPVAAPGRSAHNRGMAVDIPRSWVGSVLTVATAAGICQPFPGRDPIHFAPVESSECGGGARGRAGRFGGGSAPAFAHLAGTVLPANSVGPARPGKTADSANSAGPVK